MEKGNYIEISNSNLDDESFTTFSDDVSDIFELNISKINETKDFFNDLDLKEEELTKILYNLKDIEKYNIKDMIKDPLYFIKVIFLFLIKEIFLINTYLSLIIMKKL